MKPYDASQFQHDCCKPFLHRGSRTGLLLIHGFTGSVSHMRPLGDALAERGYTVMGINLPGHATTEADMDKTCWKDWLNASRQAVARLRGNCDRLTVAGLSMGGVLSLILAEEGLVDAIAPISAPMATQNPLIRYAALIAPFYPRASWAPENERHLQLDPAFDYGYSGFPTHNAVDLQKLIRMARKNLAKITCPVLTVQSTGDHSIWPGSAECILSGVASRDKRKLTLLDVPHACTISTELPKIIDGLDTLLRR